MKREELHELLDSMLDAIDENASDTPLEELASKLVDTAAVFLMGSMGSTPQETGLRVHSMLMLGFACLYRSDTSLDNYIQRLYDALRR